MTQTTTCYVYPMPITSIKTVQGMLKTAGWADLAIPSADLLTEACDSGHAFVASSRYGKTIGYARIISDGELVSYLAEIVVDQDYRQQGAGQALIDACAERYRSARLDLLSTLSATEFYERSGFTPKPGYRRWSA